MPQGKHENGKEKFLADNIEDPYLLDNVLTKIGATNLLSLYIIVVMGSLWILGAAASLSPAYMSPSKPCSDNCSFVTIQQEFNITKGIIDEGELLGSSYWFGTLCLGQVFSLLADRLGRKPMLIFTVIMSGIFGMIGSICQHFYLVLFVRFIQGSFAGVVTITNWVMAAECIPFKSHGITSVFFGICWVAGYCMVSLLSIIWPTWRGIMFLASLPMFLIGILLAFTLPESIAFSVEKRKVDQIEKYLNKVNKTRKEKIEIDCQKLIEANVQIKSNNQSILQQLSRLVRDKHILLCTIMQSIIWGIDFCEYNALSLTSTSVGDSRHVSFLFSGLVELPGYFVIPPMIDWLGRKPTVIISHLVTAVCMGLMFFKDEITSPYLFKGLWLLAKFAISCAYMACFVYGAELFPTAYRSICLGVCAAWCNIGAMFSPHLLALDRLLFARCSFLFHACLCLLGALATTPLPETKDSHGQVDVHDTTTTADTPLVEIQLLENDKSHY